MIKQPVLDLVRQGVVLPAAPLALTPERKFDAHRQRVLMRYYTDAGVGGVAVGMHFTQFEIRNPGVALFEPVMRTCAEELDRLSQSRGRPLVKIAGINGLTASALDQALLARDLGYDFAIVSMAAFGRHALEQDLIHHVRQVAAIMPVFGFYLLTGVGGIPLPYSFWRELVEIEKHDEVLAPGQAEEITRVSRAYPHLTDDAFVAANLPRWLAE